MARGDYVKTYAGAVAQGALNVIRGVFGAGGSISRAADLLMDRFGSLPRQVATAIASNTFRQAQARQERRLEREAARPLPSSVEIVPTNPSEYRYLVQVVAVNADGTRQVISHHWIDSPVELSEEERAARAAKVVGILFMGNKSPDIFESFEEEPPIGVEYHTELTQKRSA